MTSPVISVLMPVHNGESFLSESIESILNQTFDDFEFLIIDDGSTDNTLEIIKSYTDPRIRLLSNKNNIGLVASLNSGIDAARGRYIARMDADDICRLDRLEKQIGFLDSRPEYGLVGSWFRLFGKDEGYVRPPLEYDDIQIGLLFENVFGHPTVVFRKDIVEKHNIRYSEIYPYAQDYHFLYKVTNYCKAKNVDEILLYYRTHKSQISCRLNIIQHDIAKMIRKNILEETLGIGVSSRQEYLHDLLSCPRICKDSELVETISWSSLLIEENKIVGKFDQNLLEHTVSLKFWELFRRNARIRGPSIWPLYFKYKYRKKTYRTRLQELVSFFLLFLASIKNSVALVAISL
ncbi:MAG: glycosyltransferase [Methylococcaceae bacterium]